MIAMADTAKKRLISPDKEIAGKALLDMEVTFATLRVVGKKSKQLLVQP